MKPTACLVPNFFFSVNKEDCLRTSVKDNPWLSFDKASLRNSAGVVNLVLTVICACTAHQESSLLLPLCCMSPSPWTKCALFRHCAGSGTSHVRLACVLSKLWGSHGRSEEVQEKSSECVHCALLCIWYTTLVNWKSPLTVQHVPWDCRDWMGLVELRQTWNLYLSFQQSLCAATGISLASLCLYVWWQDHWYFRDIRICWGSTGKVMGSLSETGKWFMWVWDLDEDWTS